jgi:hypothetical protein
MHHWTPPKGKFEAINDFEMRVFIQALKIGRWYTLHWEKNGITVLGSIDYVTAKLRKAR